MMSYIARVALGINQAAGLRLASPSSVIMICEGIARDIALFSYKQQDKPTSPEWPLGSNKHYPSNLGPSPLPTLPLYLPMH